VKKKKKKKKRKRKLRSPTLKIRLRKNPLNKRAEIHLTGDGAPLDPRTAGGIQGAKKSLGAVGVATEKKKFRNQITGNEQQGEEDKKNKETLLGSRVSPRIGGRAGNHGQTKFTRAQYR